MIEVTAHRTWDADRLQVGPLQPDGAVGLALEWRVDPPSVDAETPADLAVAIAGALLEIGEVAFRSDAPPSGGARVFGWRPAAMLAMAGDTDEAARLFEWQWDDQGQMVFVLERGAETPADLMRELSTRRDWRNFAIQPPLLLTMAPAVDGDGALVCAGDPTRLDRFESALALRLAERGIALN